MDNYFLSHMSVKIPKILYGTAWKKEKTADLVEQALLSGFRGLDTACQPKHYNELLVGEGLKRAFDKGISREEIYIQTKFTSLNGQDPDNIPYNQNATLKDQVLESFAVSKKNLNTDYLDSLVLHSPMDSWDELYEVWKTLESIVESGGAKQIGISNCYRLELLRQLYQEAKIKPAVVQNRFYRESGYDIDLRQFCLEKNIFYQSFWTLTGNPHILQSEIIQEIAETKDKTPAQVFFRYLSGQNIIPLTGTTSVKHMEEDLDIFSFDLNKEECGQIHELGPFL